MTPFTIFHVAISLLGILSGFIVLVGLLTAKRLDGWTAVFLVTTVLTSLTGFLLPAHHIMPSHIVGIISLIVLAIAIYARYVRRLAGVWRVLYVISAMVALYLNVFVAIVQAFLKIKALKDLAPTQSEPPFKLTQLVVLIIFVLLAIFSAIKFRERPTGSAPGEPSMPSSKSQADLDAV